MKEQTTACKALAAMVSEKGAADKEEVRFVAHAALELGLDNEANDAVQSALREGGDFDALLSQVEKPELRRFLFRQICTVALIDDQINEQERSFIDRAAKAFGYDKSLVEEFLGWIRDGIEWEKRGAALMERM